MRGDRPIVFTNGVFDILHRGHVAYLEDARRLGASLIVAVNSDESVRRLGKGDGRPINCLADRMAVLAALRCVDEVIKMDNDTPEQLIQVIRPDVLVKGGDWQHDKIIGAAAVRSWGGMVVTIPFQHIRSTTALVDHIRRTA